MWRRRVARSACSAFLLACAGWGPEPARACSVCLAGDPQYSAFGASAQEEGAFSLYFQAQGLRKESGLLPHHDEGEGEEEHGHGNERNRSQRVDLFASWTPIDRLTLTLDVPWAHNEIQEREDGERTTHTLQGLGDVSLAATAVLWRDRDVLPSTWLEGRAFVKAPTGRDDRKRGGEVDPHLQTGTGTWDFGFGLGAGHKLELGSLYGSLLYRENGEGHFDGLDYEYGDVVLANLALEVPMGHALGRPGLDWLTLGTELNYRWADFDRADGEKYRDSGGSVLYVTPLARFRLPFGVRERPMSLRVGVQLPVTSSWLNGDQDEKEVWSVGLRVPF